MTSETLSAEEPSADEPKAKTFDDMPLSDEVRQALREMDYQHPTPVQLALWGPAVEGRDVVAQARTGTGKTAAFGLPLVDRLVKRNVDGVQALILCPTRELALQVGRELERIGQHKGVSIASVYGGAPIQRQIDAIAGGAQIVSGTPGRVLDHLRRGTLNARQIRTLVLDESDEMLSMGFERELTAIIEHLPEERQTLLFSATVPPDIERLARNRLRDPEFITLSGDHIGALEVNHFVYWAGTDKAGALLKVLEIENPESAIVFCNTREATGRLTTKLKAAGFQADWLNGDLAQSDREKVMRATREGRLRFLVATDVAARGIDISHLTHVINFDFPQDAESYVHRTGRTGRAGRTGTAVSMMQPRDIGSLYMLRLTYKIRPVERQLPTVGDERTRVEADVVAALAEDFIPRGRDPQDRALARRLLTHLNAEAIVAGMLREHLAAHPSFGDDAGARRREQLPEPVAEPPAEPAARPRRGAREAKPSDPGPDTVRESQPPPFETPAKESKPRAKKSSPVSGRATAEPSRSDKRAKAPAPQQPRASGSSEDAGEAPRRRKRRRTASSAAEAPAAEAPAADASAADASAADASAAKPPAAPTSDAGTKAASVELHLTVGRRDGARAGDIRTLLKDSGALPADAVGRIRVRERYCFVEVATEQVDAALGVLDGAEIGEAKASATLSQRSSD